MEQKTYSKSSNMKNQVKSVDLRKKFKLKALEKSQRSSKAKILCEKFEASNRNHLSEKSKIECTKLSSLRTQVQTTIMTASTSLPQIQQYCYKKHSESNSENDKKRTPLTPSASMPQKIQQLSYIRHSDNYSENEKKRRLKKKLEYFNQVGWQQRKGGHRHAHQARREKELINYMHGLPLDYDCDSD